MKTFSTCAAWLLVAALLGGCAMTLPSSGFSGGADDSVPKTQVGTGVVDPGEISSMLYGFSRIDQRGRILFLDTFNNGTAAFILGNGGAGSALPALDGARAFVAPNSVRLSPGGTTVGAVSGMTRFMALGYSSQIGVEGVFELSQNTTSPELQLVYRRKGDSTAYQARVRYDPSVPSWQYLDSSGILWVNIAGGDMPTPTASVYRFFVNAKVVADFLTHKYVRFVWGDNQFDMSSLPMATWAGYPEGVAGVGAFANYLGSPYSADVYLGLLVFTRDEQP